MYQKGHVERRKGKEDPWDEVTRGTSKLALGRPLR